MGGPIGPRLIGHLCVQNCRGRHQKQMQCHASHNLNKCQIDAPSFTFPSFRRSAKQLQTLVTIWWSRQRGRRWHS